MHPGGITFVVIYTATELRLSTPFMEDAQVVDLDLFERAYRHGLERADELCRQLFAVTGNKL